MNEDQYGLNIPAADIPGDQIEEPLPADEEPSGERGSSTVLEKFGGDTEKLASAYEHLEQRFGAQGRELGDLRTQMTALAGKLAGGSEGKQESDPVDSIMARLKEAEEAGGDPMRVLVEGVLGASTAAVDQAIKPVQKTLTQTRTSSMWSQFLRDVPEAAALEDAMTDIFKENPNLVPIDKGDAAFKRGLGMLYREAMHRTGTKPARRRSRETLDQGRSVRRGRGTDVDETGFTEAARRAKETGADADVENLLQHIMKPLPE